jgi:hypothetical protein
MPQNASLHKDLVGLLVSIIYLIYWSYAFAIGTAVSLLVAAFFPLFFEMFGGYFHLGEVPSDSEWPHWFIVVGYWLLLLAIALWHWEEAKKQQREKYSLAFRLGMLYEFDRIMTAQGKTPEVKDLLRYIYKMFGPLQIAHVALHRRDENGEISIAKHEVYPETEDISFCTPLKKGKGVAGLVFEDSMTRYVPRIFLPKKYRRFLRIFMPHAVRVEFETMGESEPAIRKLEMEANVLAPSPDGKFSFDSFLSIPVSSSDGTACIAVLSLDFSHCNTLKKADIALAHYVGSSIGRIVK